jgi:hypothetical protein
MRGVRLLGLMGWLVLSVPLARADVEHVEVDSAALNVRAPQIHGPHVALRDADATSRHRLVVFLPGTNGTASDAVPTLDALAREGYHALTLDYPNSVLSAQFRPSKDPRAFDTYRRAVVHGGKVDATLTVAADSSIEGRLTSALRYLATEHRSEGWGEFSNGQGVAWDKLILAGLSQGAGHAAFLAHEHKVAKVLAVSGPQDYLTELKRPARWASASSATPRDRYRALLHRADEYDVNLQLAVNRALVGPHAPEPVSFTAELPTTSKAPPILVSERPLDASDQARRAQHPDAAVAHASLARPAYAAVWLYLIAH